MQAKKQLLRQQLDVDAKRRAFRASPEFANQLDAAFLDMERRIRWALPLLQAMRPRREASMARDGLGITVSACGYGLTLKWHRPANTFRSACLFVTLWNRPVVSFDLAPGRAKRLLEERFDYDLGDSGRAMFFAADRHAAYASDELAVVGLKFVIDRLRGGPLGWLR